MKSSALPAWLYRNPESIMDGVRARTARQEKKEKDGSKKQVGSRDIYYRMSRAMEIKSMVKIAKRGEGHA